MNSRKNKWNNMISIWSNNKIVGESLKNKFKSNQNINLFFNQI